MLRAVRHALGDKASAVAEAVWTLGFRGLGRLRRRPVARWQPLGGGTVLVVAPHPDDETLGCGGALLLHRRGGDRVVVVQVTDGRASRAGGLDADGMARQRLAEARLAAQRLDVELEALRLPEGGWQPAELAPRLRQRLTELAAGLIYAPSPIDYHPEHLRVAQALADALADCQAVRVRVVELGVPLGTGLVNLVAEVAAVEPARRAALAAYTSQAAGVAGLVRLRRYAAAFWGVPGAAESFWELSPAQYRAIVAAGSWLGGPTPYRGLRPRAPGDPLSYALGGSARRRLLGVARRAARRPRPSS